MSWYWFLFGYFAFGALLTLRAYQQPVAYQAPGAVRPSAPTRTPLTPMLALGGLFLTVAIGLRYRVGADWPTYEMLLNQAAFRDLGYVLDQGEPGYQFLNWLAQQLQVDIWLVNLVCGTLFAWGLIKLALTQRNPWLAILVAIPYLVLVVAMGYTRQSVAIGILMAGLASRIQGGSILRFAVYVLFATLFHRTAVVALPLIAVASDRSRLTNMLIGVAVAYFLYQTFLVRSVDIYVRNYLEAGYASEGAAVRVTMNLVPAVLFLAFQRRFAFPERERLIWRNYALAAIALAGLLVVLPSSTAVDRIALYIIPLQLAILARVPGQLLSWGWGTALVIGYAFAVQFTWLNFAKHAEFWLPYRFYPF